MRERNQILELWQKARSTGQWGVLATVVKTQGSSYRLPGARLLLTQSGERAGGISGGCLEDDLIKKAHWLTANGPAVRKYDTTADGEIAAGGYGLGCNGIIHVLLERVTEEDPSVLPYLEAAATLRRSASIAHLIAPHEVVGKRVVLEADDKLHVSSSIACTVSQEVLDLMPKAYDSELITLSNGYEVFLEKLAPPLHLLVFGAGDDAIPLVELTKYLGWQVSVFDGRAHYARADRFPLANQVAIRPLHSPAPPIDRWTAAVVMTHSYTQDLDIVRTLVHEPLPYLGILGPRKRALQLLAEADASRVHADLHSPMGLDLGGHGPEQVAVSVIAEIQAVFNRRRGGFLRDRSSPIHGEHAPEDSSQASDWIRSIVCA